MSDFNDWLHGLVNSINSATFSPFMLYLILFTGVLFTFWTKFGQYRALTHGIAVIRGKYDDHNDPGAINHFQALSTALSGTVGLGNIAGVALAISIGGPGAVFWMWIIGFLGMSVKMTEVSLAMMHRDDSDPANPHGGPMFVARRGFAAGGSPIFGRAIGAIFVVTLLMATITTPMLQSWSVADTTSTYFNVDGRITGAILAIFTGAVIIGGIRWIGKVTGIVVPLMCVVYIIAALIVLTIHVTDIPAMLMLIVRSGLPTWLGGSTVEATGAFVGGGFGIAFAQGMKRALYSSEAGQGSAPIAHAAAKTDEPIREGIVAGLEPFIDTLLVCTMTALVILCTGALTREAEVTLTPQQLQVIPDGPNYTFSTVSTEDIAGRDPAAIKRLGYGDGQPWRNNDKLAVIIDTATGPMKVTGTVIAGTVDWETFSAKSPTLITNDAGDVELYGEYVGSTLTAQAFDRTVPGLGKYLVSITIWLFALSTIISWSYYGEQGLVWLFGRFAGPIILVYKLGYVVLVFLVNWPGFIESDAEIDMWSTLGLGVMLAVNVPLMLIFGERAMKAYHEYVGRLKRGELDAHARPPVADVVSGHDVDEKRS